MLSFIEFLEERSADPVELGQRVARRFGKKKSFGKWEKVEKGGHIPLTNFDARKSNSAGDKLWKVQKKLGMDSRDKEERAAGKQKYDDLHTRKKMEIKDLHATQPFVRTTDVERLKNKVSETDPQHIHVVTHKGEHYVADGHHAVMAAKLRGDKHVTVNHIDLDKHA
jgi:hypothetical protein